MFLEELSSLDLIDAESYVDPPSLKLPETEPFSVNFQNAGYDSTLFWINGGAIMTNFGLNFSQIAILVTLSGLWICWEKAKGPT